MRSKQQLFCATVVFLAANCVSGINYGFHVGQWEAYIAIFGLVELALVAAALAATTVRWAAHFLWRFGRSSSEDLSVLAVFPYVPLSLMHVFPAVYALGGTAGANSMWYLLYHVGCILLGWYVIRASIEYLRISN